MKRLKTIFLVIFGLFVSGAILMFAFMGGEGMPTRFWPWLIILPVAMTFLSARCFNKAWSDRLKRYAGLGVFLLGLMAELYLFGVAVDVNLREAKSAGELIVVAVEEHYRSTRDFPEDLSFLSDTQRAEILAATFSANIFKLNENFFRVGMFFLEYQFVEADPYPRLIISRRDVGSEWDWSSGQWQDH